MATRIKIRRDLAANWTATNPRLQNGERGLETDTRKTKMGDGVLFWNDLPYEFSLAFIAQPDNQIVKGTGVSIDSSPKFIHDDSTDTLTLTDTHAASLISIVPGMTIVSAVNGWDAGIVDYHNSSRVFFLAGADDTGVTEAILQSTWLSDDGLTTKIVELRAIAHDGANDTGIQIWINSQGQIAFTESYSAFGTGAVGSTHVIRFQELAVNGANYFGIKAASSITTTRTLVLPNDDPAAGEVLSVVSFSSGVITTEWAAVSGSGGGTVTSVSVVTNQGVSGSVATATTTPAITISLGALTGVTSVNGLVITPNTGVVTTGTWSATAIAETRGGTNQTSYTLGDILYASAANTLSKLAGNITGTRKFLRQDGTGAISSAPTWSVLLSADIPDLSGTYLTVSTAAATYLPLDGATAGATSQAQEFTLGVKTNSISEISGGANVEVQGWVMTNAAFYPVTDGSDIGLATTNRIGTIFMASSIDYVTNMNFKVGGVTKLVIDNTGAITTGEWKGTAIGSQYGGMGVNNAGRTLTIAANSGTISFTSSVTLTVAATASVSGTNTGDQTTVSGNAGTATALQNARTIGGVSFDGTANITVATATGGFTVSGGNLALGANSITMSGSIGVTGTRVTKGWFTDLEVTNTIVGSVNGNAATVTTNANLTGDVTSSGNATTIANSAVTLAKMANMATASILGRNTAGSGAPEVLSPSTTKTILALDAVENTALSTWAGTANITTLGTITTGVWTGTNIANNKIVTALSSHTMVWSAGTTSTAAQTFASGAFTTAGNVAAGQLGFDGTIIGGVLDTTSGWGQVPIEQYAHLTAAGTTISTIANFFGATSNISLVASAYYEIEIWCYFLCTTAGTVTWTLTNSAAPTGQNIYFEMSPVTGIVAPPGTATTLVGETYNDATAAFAFTTGTLTTAVNHFAYFKIWLKNGTGTSLKIQATKNVGGTITPGINSWWKCTRRSPNNIGTLAS